MIEARRKATSGKTQTRFELLQAGKPLSYSEVIVLWQHDSSFRDVFIELLASSSFSAFRWETPPVSRETLSRDFEFVLLDCPQLGRRPDVTAFNEFFSEAEVVTFKNLSGDAHLIAPCPRGLESNYVHLAKFIRNAPVTQVHELWRLVGRTLEAVLSQLGADSESLWLSTAGMGVAWLHVRIDRSPKYYGYRAYKTVPVGDHE